MACSRAVTLNINTGPKRANCLALPSPPYSAITVEILNFVIDPKLSSWPASKDKHYRNPETPRILRRRSSRDRNRDENGSLPRAGRKGTCPRNTHALFHCTPARTSECIGPVKFFTSALEPRTTSKRIDTFQRRCFKGETGSKRVAITRNQRRASSARRNTMIEGGG